MIYRRFAHLNEGVSPRPCGNCDTQSTGTQCHACACAQIENKIGRTTTDPAMLISVSPIDPRDAQDEVVRSLLPTFLQRRADDVQRIRDALAMNDFAVIATIGHNLRGNGASYGFPMLSSIGEAIEKAAVARDASAIASTIAGLNDELARIDSSRPK